MQHLRLYDCPAQFVRDHTKNFKALLADVYKFEKTEAFTGCEFVHDTHRLALMNAMLHNLDGKIILGDTLSDVLHATISPCPSRLPSAKTLPTNFKRLPIYFKALSTNCGHWRTDDDSD